MFFVAGLVNTAPNWNPHPSHSTHIPYDSQTVCLSVTHFTETAILANTLYIKGLDNNERISRSLNLPV